MFKIIKAVKTQSSIKKRNRFKNNQIVVLEIKNIVLELMKNVDRLNSKLDIVEN